MTVIGNVDPVKLLEMLEKKTKKKVELVSPQPKKDKGKGTKGGDNKQEKNPEKEKFKEIPVTTVVMKLNLDCQGCIKKLRKAVAKTKGLVTNSVADLALDQVMVTSRIFDRQRMVLACRVLALLAFLLSSSSVAAGSDDSEQLWSIATNSWEKEPSLTTLAVGLTMAIFLGVCVFICYLLLFAPQAATGPVPAVAQPMVAGSVDVPRVLDQQEIELFPLLSFQSDNIVGFGESNCVICFDEFVDRGNVRALPCGHIFHPDCIDSWLTSKSTKCPVCRRDYSG